jgi:formate dehydrogenase iron-sulfur subunit
MTGELVAWSNSRFVAGVLGGVLLPMLLVNQAGSMSELGLIIIGLAAFAASVIGETLERTLFFTAAVAPRMPGALKT